MLRFPERDMLAWEAPRYWVGEAFTSPGRGRGGWHWGSGLAFVLPPFVLLHIIEALNTSESRQDRVGTPVSSWVGISELWRPAPLYPSRALACSIVVKPVPGCDLTTDCTV